MKISFLKKSGHRPRSKQRPRSSHDLPLIETRSGLGGASIRCQLCSGQDFRRSRLRSEDFKQIVLMRYPVRCLRCSQRQMVSFTVAGISIPSHIKQQRPIRTGDTWKSWAEPGDSGARHTLITYPPAAPPQASSPKDDKAI